jgi:hypothetical protein
MIASHWLAYLLASPDPHSRAHLLQATGHGYWPSASWLAAGVAIAGLGSFIGGRIAPVVRKSRGAIFRHALPRFLILQVGGFVALEFGERILAGHSVGMATLFESTLLIGLVVQVVAAVAASLLLVAIAFVVDRLFRVAPSRTRRTSTTRPLVSLISAVRLVPATGAHSLRGPPALS